MFFNGNVKKARSFAEIMQDFEKTRSELEERAKDLDNDCIALENTLNNKRAEQRLAFNAQKKLKDLIGI